MLKIVVFDDNEMELSVTFDILSEFTKQENIEAKILAFTDKDEAIQCITEKKADVVFLDILVNDQILGIEMAKEINALSEDTQIVFLTGFLHYATDIYDTRHIYYVLKSELRQRLPGVFTKIEKVSDSKKFGDYPIFGHISKL